MGIRGELFSTKIALPNRTYFFNVKENRLGDLYLNIVESKNKETGGFDRQSVILFAEDLPVFLQKFDESLKVMEKAVREKGREKRLAAPRQPRGESDGGKKAYARKGKGEKPAGEKKGRRVVVKKQSE